jgi:hypothetical protein
MKDIEKKDKCQFVTEDGTICNKKTMVGCDRCYEHRHTDVRIDGNKIVGKLIGMGF